MTCSLLKFGQSGGGRTKEENNGKVDAWMISVEKEMENYTVKINHNWATV